MALTRYWDVGKVAISPSRLLLALCLLCWPLCMIEVSSQKVPNVTITNAGQEILVVENSDGVLQFTCQSNNEPPPDLTWVRGGNFALELSPDEPGISIIYDSASLALTINVSEADSDRLASREGVLYYCQATNSLGTARSQAVSLRYPSFDGFNETLKNEVAVLVRIGEEQAVALQCGYIGTPVPKPEVTWFRDQVPIVIDPAAVLPHYRVLGEGELVIYDLLTSDIMNSNSEPSQYRCRVDNVRMVESQTAPFFYSLYSNEANTLLEDPTVYVVPPAFIFLMENEPAVLYFIYASNGGTPDLVVSQTPEALGEVLEDEPNLRVLLNNGVQRNSVIFIHANYIESGQRLAAYNPAVVTKTTVTLIEPLVIDVSTTRNQVFRAFTNETIFNFICNASGSQLALVWYKNGEQISANGPTLTISKAVPDDSGVYQCFWTSEIRPSQIFDSVSWALVVRDRVQPNMINITTSVPLDNDGRVIVLEGTMVTIDLTVRSDFMPQISWNFTNLDGSSGPLDTSNSTLYQTDIAFLGEDFYFLNLTVRMTVETSGWYLPIIDDGFNEPSIGRVQFMSVEFPAQVISLVSSHTCLLVGEVVSITCEVGGLPEPTVSFFKNSEAFQLDQCHSCNVSGNALTFFIVTRDDQGSYGCAAQNTNDGETAIDSESLHEGTTFVYCDHPEVSVEGPSNVTATEGDDVTLSCRVTSVPPPVVTWMFNDININISSDVYTTTQTSNGDYSLIIESVVTSNSGIYTCQVNNTAIPEVVKEDINLTVNPVLVGYWYAVIAVGVVLFIAVSISLGLLCCWHYFSRKKLGARSGPEARSTLQNKNDERGNVDCDSDEDEDKVKEPPAQRPAAPPEYKPPPAYGEEKEIELGKMPISRTQSVIFD